MWGRTVSVDWDEVASEVASALKEVSGDGAGFPVVIKSVIYADALHPDDASPSYADFVCVQSSKRLAIATAPSRAKFCARSAQRHR